MEIALVCRSCAYRFVAAAETPEDEVIRRMIEEGSWLALGDGDCFRDMVRAALSRRGRIACSECGDPMEVCSTLGADWAWAGEWFVVRA